MEQNAKIYVAGHRGMVGAAIVRKLQEQGFHNLVLRTSKELNLTNQQMVADFFAQEQPDYVFMAAAKVGGIHANNAYPADFAYQNLMIQNNVIHNCYVQKVKKLLFLGSSCIYPKMAPQPLQEQSLLSGYLEPTNEAYAIAKIAGLRMCAYYRKQYGCDFISAMPTNLFGPGDNFDLENSHVLPALIRKFHEAKVNNQPQVVIWGTGTPLREFHYVDDLADGLLFVMNHYSQEEHINIGTGEEISIGNLALLIKETVGFQGELVQDTSKPDGTPRKVMDHSKIHSLGWKSTVTLQQGIQYAYQWFLDNYSSIRK
jgi:GDP-L-fucose synthase